MACSLPFGEGRTYLISGSGQSRWPLLMLLDTKGFLRLSHCWAYVFKWTG